MTNDHIHGDPDRVDFAPLDPRADASRFYRLVREVRRAAAPELVRRQSNLNPWGQIASWRRPILSASGLLALASAAVLLLVQPPAGTQTTLAEAFGVPSEVAHWVHGTDKPTAGDLFGLERSEA